MVYTIISTFIHTFLITYLSLNIHSKRFPEEKVNNLCFIALFLINSAININGISTHSSLLITITIALYVFALFRNSFVSLSLSLVCFFVIISISEIFALLVMNVINYIIELNLDLFMAIAIIISNLLSTILIYALCKYLQLLKSRKLPKTSYLILILPVSTLIIILSINDYYSLIGSYYYFALAIFGLFTSNVITILFFMKIIKSINIEKELKLSNQKTSTLYFLKHIKIIFPYFTVF